MASALRFIFVIFTFLSLCPTAQHDGTRTPRPTVPSCCAVVVRSCGLYLLRPGGNANYNPNPNTKPDPKPQKLMTHETPLTRWMWLLYFVYRKRLGGVWGPMASHVSEDSLEQVRPHLVSHLVSHTLYRALKGCCCGNQLIFGARNILDWHHLYCLHWRFKTNWNTSMPMWCYHIVWKFGELRSSNSGVYETQLCPEGIDQYSGQFICIH